MRGCEAVFHVAADYRLWMKSPAEMYEANVEGTRSILKAAADMGIKRTVYCSSVATMGFKSDGTIVDEQTSVSEADMIGHYKRSKWQAEQIAIEAVRNGQEVVIVNPTAPMGERDIKPTPTGKIIVDFLNGKFPAYVDTGMNLVDVREVAKAHILAYHKGTPGERYIIGGENLTLKQLLDRLGTITGLKSPTMKVPHAMAMGYALWEEAFTGRLLGREPRATIEAVQMGKKKMWASSDKAHRELGYEAKPVEDALRRAVGWFQRNGYAAVGKGAA